MHAPSQTRIAGENNILKDSCKTTQCTTANHNKREAGVHGILRDFRRKFQQRRRRYRKTIQKTNVLPTQRFKVALVLVLCGVYFGTYDISEICLIRTQLWVDYFSQYIPSNVGFDEKSTASEKLSML